MSIAAGDRAPRFTAIAHTGERISLDDFLGKQVVVLYFYPRDGTGICTAEACGFRDAYEEFAAAGAVVIGVSRDSLQRHQQFVQERRLPFLLVSDHDRAWRRRSGCPGCWGCCRGGRPTSSTKRALCGTFSARISRPSVTLPKRCASRGSSRNELASRYRLSCTQPPSSAGRLVAGAGLPTVCTGVVAGGEGRTRK